MKGTRLALAGATVMLAGSCGMAMAAMSLHGLTGSLAPLNAAQRSVTIGPETRSVNAQGGEVVRFNVDGKAFAWDFTVPLGLTNLDLHRVAPQGMLDHPVTVYLTPDPRYLP